MIVISFMLAAASFAVAWLLMPSFHTQHKTGAAGITANQSPLPNPTPYVYETNENPAPVTKPVQPVPAPTSDMPLHNQPQQPVLQPQLPRYMDNAVPTSTNTGTVPIKGKIAIVIDDVGVVEQGAADSVMLPPAITLSFLPYGEFTLDYAARARILGHEIMVHLPMEAKTPTGGKAPNPGPNALYTHYSLDQVRDLARHNIVLLADLAVGVNNHMGSKFTEWQAGMEEVLKVVQEERLFFMDSVTTPHSAVDAAAKGMSLPILHRNVFLDHEQTPEFVHNALQKLEEMAELNGAAVGIGHPHKVTIQALNNWAPTLAAKGLALVPITELIAATTPIETAPAKSNSTPKPAPQTP